MQPKLSLGILEEEGEKKEKEGKKGKPRIQKANRAQIEMRMAALDDLIPAEHKVRIVWEMTQEYDLRELYEKIEAIEGEAGRPAIDPRIIVALWLYATTEGVGSARALARLCEEHVAYQWILGGVSVNYHTLADFRVGFEKEMDEILTENVAALMKEGVVSLECTAQDGIRVRASAGGNSFRREKRLEEYLAEAEQAVKILKESMENGEGGELSKRQQAAQKRAKEERVERLKKSLTELKKVKEAKERDHQKKEKRKEGRSSTTDPEVRVMKMPDGGFRPAFNGEFSVDVESGVVVGVEVTNQVDQGQMWPMLKQTKQRYKRYPGKHFVDGGFVIREDMEKAQAEGIQVYAPLPEKNTKESDTKNDKAEKTVVSQPWRVPWEERMNSEEGKETYKQRSSSIEWVNALARNRGLQRFVVRGIEKARAVLIWFVLAHNLWTVYRVRRQASAI